MKREEFEVLTITGTPFERGQVYGERKRDDILQYLQYFYSLTGDVKGGEEELYGKVRKYIPFIQEYSPTLIQELEGVARGCGSLLEEIVMLTLHEEFQGFVDNCTSFAVTGRATEDGEVIQGQTWDIPVELCREARPFLLIRKGQRDPAVFSFTYSGLLAGAGFNEAGLTLSWNSLPRLHMEVGVPTYVIIAEILRQETIGEALYSISRAKRAGCFNFVLTDKSEIYMVEATPEHLDILYSSTHLSHANHYLSPKFRERQSLTEVMSRYSSSSIVRQNRMERLLRERIGSINVEVSKDLLKDHVNYPHSICRHPGRECEIPMITCASWVMKPSEGTWWVSNGPPCTYPFLPYSIEGG